MMVSGFVFLLSQYLIQNILFDHKKRRFNFNNSITLKKLGLKVCKIWYYIYILTGFYKILSHVSTFKKII